MKTYTSVDNVVRRAEENLIREKMAGARSPMLSIAELGVGLKKLITSKIWWLEKFSTGNQKRPEHELKSRRHELAVLVQSYDRVTGRGADAADPPS